MISFDVLFPTGVQHFIIGGLLIGFGVSLLFLATGLIGGMSSVFTTVWSYCSKVSFFHSPSHLESRQWRLVYALGLILGSLFWTTLSGTPVPTTEVSSWQLLIGGFIAGFGARYSNGCTSGHGICGMASLSPQSFMAVAVFLGVAIITAQLVAHLQGAI